MVGAHRFRLLLAVGKRQKEGFVGFSTLCYCGADGGGGGIEVETGGSVEVESEAGGVTGLSEAADVSWEGVTESGEVGVLFFSPANHQ